MIPTPYVLKVKRYVVGAADDHGNVAPTYAAPADWRVHAVAPGAMIEQTGQGRDVSMVAYTVLAPVSTAAPGELDLVTVDGVDYEVNARPADWSRGPWSYPDAGVTVELKRVEG